MEAKKAGPGGLGGTSRVSAVERAPEGRVSDRERGPGGVIESRYDSGGGSRSDG